MLRACHTSASHFPPTLLYNEGWLLRLILNWFATHPTTGHYLSFPENGDWYSEALLPSAFLPRRRGDEFAESWTHADGAIGHFAIEEGGVLSLLRNATHLTIVEAKMFARLSAGVTHAQYYDQAARTVACIAEIVGRWNGELSELSYLAFYVIAPQSQIADGVFAGLMTRDSIRETVERRVNEYDESKEDWFQRCFLPTVEEIALHTIGWEEIISEITEFDSSSGSELKDFYELCLRFNQPYSVQHAAD